MCARTRKKGPSSSGTPTNEMASYLPAPPKVPLVRASWSLLDGIWGVLKGSWGVLVGTWALAA